MKIKTLRELEKDHLSDLLKKTGWDLAKTARLLKIPLPLLKRKMKEHDLKRNDQ